MSTSSPVLRLLTQCAYTLLGGLAVPLAFISARMRSGWRQRLGMGLPGSCDIWIQGASAGECALIQGLVNGLQEYSVLATTCTRQGMDVLGAVRSAGPFFARMLPLDLPPLIHLTLARIRPKVVVLLETEIWPGLLLACADRGIPVIIVNGRMSSRSFAGYLRLRPFLALCPPARIAAIAEPDAFRYGMIFSSASTHVTGNSKFDRALDTPFLHRADNPLQDLIPCNAMFIVLGSVREEEEPKVLELIRRIRVQRPDCLIGLFPRHLHRIQAWQTHLQNAGIGHVCRSNLTTATTPGSVIIWDKFGELGQAYGLAHRAFVGGSLAPLGGQNFLEPLAQGVLTAVGPHVRNFAWVGNKIFQQLVFMSNDLAAIAHFLTAPAAKREEIRASTERYIRTRQGATAAAIGIIIEHLSRSPQCP